MSEKRKRGVPDLSQKLDIIKRLRRGESAVSIALIYDIGHVHHLNNYIPSFISGYFKHVLKKNNNFNSSTGFTDLKIVTEFVSWIFLVKN